MEQPETFVVDPSSHVGEHKWYRLRNHAHAYGLPGMRGIQRFHFSSHSALVVVSLSFAPFLVSLFTALFLPATKG